MGSSHDDLEALFRYIAADPFARRLGMVLDEIRPGYARYRMRVDESMCQFFGTIHGGVIFSLADAALGAAANSHGTVAVAMSMEIQYLVAGRPGEELVAEAVEEDLTRRTGLYRIIVRESESGSKIAALQARVYRLDRPVLPATAPDPAGP